ncbi:MAG TPA: RNA polymerase sigma factor [Rhizomicrobium sp.]|nr:RNA polymerase sigma factor [Rhizomicrobium sp.]
MKEASLPFFIKKVNSFAAATIFCAATWRAYACPYQLEDNALLFFLRGDSPRSLVLIGEAPNSNPRNAGGSRGMVEIPDTDREGADQCQQGAAMTVPEVQAWFVREVLPLEAVLMQFLRRSTRNHTDAEDLRQEVYMRVCEAAQSDIPHSAKSFVFTVARNLLIDRARREPIVSIEAVADLETLNVAIDEPGPDRNAIARDELRRLQAALENLPQRFRSAVVMRKVDGLSRREIAARLGITEKTVERHLTEGLRALASSFYGESTNLGRQL